MQNDTKTAIYLLRGTNVNISDAVRILRGALDLKPVNCSDGNLSYLMKVVNLGISAVKRGIKSKPIFEAYHAYLEEKSSNLKPTSLRDIKTIANRIFRKNPTLKERFAGDISSEEWLKILNCQFPLPNQFNKARTMLHGVFEFATRREWCDKNPVKLIERRRIIEKEISPLSFPQIKNLIKTAKMPKHKECLPAIGLLMFAGVRPREVHRLTWKDIDLEENSITIHSLCSKTGGVRQVEICSSLKRLLAPFANGQKNERVCPKNWQKRWRDIRNDSGFKNVWVQDILRHTYASYHAKRFKDLPRLQLNMGHYDLSLLRSRYVNMRGISHTDARDFFN